MSMYDETKKVLEGCDEVMKMAVAEAGFGLDAIASMDETTMKAMVAVSKLYVQSKDLVLKQAKIMDTLERQNEELLKKVDDLWLERKIK